MDTPHQRDEKYMRAATEPALIAQASSSSAAPSSPRSGGRDAAKRDNNSIHKPMHQGVFAAPSSPRSGGRDAAKRDNNKSE